MHLTWLSPFLSLIRLAGVLAIGPALHLGAQSPSTTATPTPDDVALPPGLYAEFTTPRGVITAKLFHEKAPLTVTSFVGLAEGKLGPEPRKPFFDGLKFHRVVPDFVVQGGDPRGDGEGGPGYEFADEFSRELRHDVVGVLSMANAGPDTNGSQFFFTLRPVERLDFLHSVFGQVVKGIEILPLIQQGDTMEVKILRRGPMAEAFLANATALDRLAAITPRFPYPYFDDPHRLLPQDPPRARGYQNKLANLARFTPVPIYFRLYDKRDSLDADRDLEGIARRHAEMFGVRDRGAVALYFADKDEWALWIPDSLVPCFAPTRVELPAAQEAFFQRARERAAANQGSPTFPLNSSHKLKILVDEVMQGLVDVLLPVSPTNSSSAPPAPPASR
ncbi:MAG TPA: peptidylprolyl isomerase [Opitutaceae bacterium]|nr:peptidylprolyl isomerase [Opitutaceae bacterium]